MNICNICREDIQNSLDNNSPFSDKTKKHVKKCHECNEYLEFFLRIKNKAKKEIDNKIKKIDKINFSILDNEINNKLGIDKIFPFKKYLAIAAVFIFIIFSSYFVSMYIKNQKELKVFMIKENSEYIANLMDYSLDNFEEENNLYELSTDWFDGVELVNEIMGEFVLNNGKYFEKE